MKRSITLLNKNKAWPFIRPILTGPLQPSVSFAPKGVVGKKIVLEENKWTLCQGRRAQGSIWTSTKSRQSAALIAKSDSKLDEFKQKTLKHPILVEKKDGTLTMVPVTHSSTEKQDGVKVITIQVDEKTKTYYGSGIRCSEKTAFKSGLLFTQPHSNTESTLPSNIEESNLAEVAIKPISDYIYPPKTGFNPSDQ